MQRLVCGCGNGCGSPPPPPQSATLLDFVCPDEIQKFLTQTLLSLALFAAEAQSVTAELDRDRTRNAQAQAHQVKYQHTWLLSFAHKLSRSLVLFVGRH
jgi:hypothetical protein